CRQPVSTVPDHQEAEWVRYGFGRLPDLRRGRVPSGWAECHLPTLRLGYLRTVGRRPRRMQSYRGALANGWKRPRARYFGTASSDQGDSAVVAQLPCRSIGQRAHVFTTCRRFVWTPPAPQAAYRWGAGSRYGCGYCRVERFARRR